MRDATRWVLVMMVGALMACGGMDEEAPEEATAGQDLRGGTALSIVPSAFTAVARVGSCSGVLVSEYGVLTAASCVTDGATEVVTFGGGRGFTTGTAFHHPEFASDPDYDLAVVRFDRSVYSMSTVNASGMNPFPLRSLIMPEPTEIVIFGYGARDQGCLVSSYLNFAFADLIELVNLGLETEYIMYSADVSMCPADVGGPMMMLHEGQWHVAGVLRESSGGLTYMAPTRYASQWIRRVASYPRLRTASNLSPDCKLYDGWNLAGSSSSSSTGRASLGSMNDRASSVWVRRGSALRAYSGSSYTGSTWSYGGMNGDSCDEDGCYHDLRGTTADGAISSFTCLSQAHNVDLGWSDCVAYENMAPNWYDRHYFNDDIPDFADRGYRFDNRLNQLWVRRGHVAFLYRDRDYRGESLTLFGTPGQGGFCDSGGCVHDLVGTRFESTATSARCF
jgi:hypothetical protein